MTRMIVRLRRIRAAVPARQLATDVLGAVILFVIFWKMPTVLAVLAIATGSL